MNRRVFLFALLVVGGCSDKRDPKGADGARRTSITGNNQSNPDGLHKRPPRVAILSFGIPGVAGATGSATGPSLVRKRLAELGYVDGQTIAIDERYAEGDPERLDRLAIELVASKPDVIISIAAAATTAVRRQTSTIPIVMAHAGDPVGAGFAASMSSPGGNVTGTTSMAPDLGVKQVELLRELVPGLATLGVVVNPTNAGTPLMLANVNDAASRSNVRVVVAEVRRSDDFDSALAGLDASHLQALLVMIEPMIYLNRARVLEFAAAHRLPTSFDVGREIVREGGLLSYGPVLTPHYALVAEYVDQLLRGADPAKLPIQQPTQFALVINLKTANSLGINVPQSLLARADEVIR